MKKSLPIKLPVEPGGQVARVGERVAGEAGGVRLLQWRHAIDAREYEVIKRAGAVESYLHSTASRALADRIIRDSAFRVVEEAPNTEDPWGGTRATITYSIAIGDRSSAGNLARQLEEARAEGMRDAAEIARSASERYGCVEGFCAPVIRSSLQDAARDIDNAAAVRAEAARSHEASAPQPRDQQVSHPIREDDNG